MGWWPYDLHLLHLLELLYLLNSHFPLIKTREQVLKFTYYLLSTTKICHLFNSLIFKPIAHLEKNREKPPAPAGIGP